MACGGKNLSALADLSGKWIDSVHGRRSRLATKQWPCQNRISTHFEKRVRVKQDGMSEPREEKSAMLPTKPSLDSKIAARNKRQADVLWKILMLMRLVIPAYVLYVIYLYWTVPPSAYLLTGH
jgi:hypothetical protein